MLVTESSRVKRMILLYLKICNSALEKVDVSIGIIGVMIKLTKLFRALKEETS